MRNTMQANLSFDIMKKKTIIDIQQKTDPKDNKDDPKKDDGGNADPAAANDKKDPVHNPSQQKSDDS